MTPRQRKLQEILNVRLDEPLAREIARIAGSKGESESEVARTLLTWGIEVQRRLEAHELAKPFGWRTGAEAEPWPTVLELSANWRPMTEEEVDQHGLRSYVGYPNEDAREQEDEHR